MISVKTLEDVSIPKDKNLVFVRPDLSQWPMLLAQNKMLIGTFPGRDATRKELYEIASEYTGRIIHRPYTCEGAQSIIVTGHQAVWHHCGVWAKSVAAYKFAQANNGCCLQLVLDHDKSNVDFIFPYEESGGHLHFDKVTISDSKTNTWLETRVVRSQLVNFICKVTRARPEAFCSDIWLQPAVHRKLGTADIGSIADAVTLLQAVLNDALGLKMLYLPVSRMCRSNAFVNFALWVMSNARDFAISYNFAITERIESGQIKLQETVRQLEIDDKRALIELPFWLVATDGSRMSLYVSDEQKERLQIFVGLQQKLGEIEPCRTKPESLQLRDLLRKSGYHFRPKAVSLTLFVRLFLADWFIHGVGAMWYEYITDRIIERYCNLGNLNYGVVTTTVTLPLQRTSLCWQSLAQLKLQLRSMRHSPEKYIPEPLCNTEPIKSLIKSKRRHIMDSRDSALPQSARRLAWCSLSKINSKLTETISQELQECEKALAMSQKDQISKQVRNYREYFFGLFPESMLRRLMAGITFANKT